MLMTTTLLIMLITTTVHGHFNRKNIRAPKSVLECVEKLVSHSLLDQRFYCIGKTCASLAFSELDYE